MTRRITRRSTLALGGGALLSAPSLLRAQATLSGLDGPADMIVRDAVILTQDPARPRASALAVKDGLVVAVGADADVAPFAADATQRIEAGGRTMIPGLVDSHMHPTRGGRFYATELRWDGVGSLARGLEMIREQAARTPDGQWVRVIGGWSPWQFEERRMPTPAELTAAAPDVPVYVLFLYSRGFLNRAAVAARGLTPETEAPEGTRYEFTEDGGAILHAEPNPDLLYASIGALPGLDVETQELSARHFYRELNRFGLTSVIDAGGGGHQFPDDYEASARLAASGALGVRLANYLFPQTAGEEMAQFREWTSTFRVGANAAHDLRHGYGVEGGGEFLVWSAGDYENFLAERPDITDRDGWREDLAEVTQHLLVNGWPLRIHATYDQSVNHILDVFETVHAQEVLAGRAGFGGIRWAIDHGETLTRPTIDRIAALQGGLSMQARMAYAGEAFLERYGREATDNAPPLRDVIEAGVPLGLGTDGTRVASYNPWPALKWAITGLSVGGTELHSRRHRLSRLEALHHYTAASAWFSGEELIKGRLRPGYLADFALLDRPYLEVPDAELDRIESDLTVVGGRVNHAAGGFDGLAADLPPIQPDWSPVAAFGGYQG